MSKIKKRNIILTTIIAIFIIMAITLIINWPVIFQKGNPIPYLKSILQLNDNQTFIQVQEDNPIIFITKRDNYNELHKYIENNYNVSLNEQVGSLYLFSSDEKLITVRSEIYWRFYIVWTMIIE
jgi:hypothetical protein